jgi:hypothetical protein
MLTTLVRPASLRLLCCLCLCFAARTTVLTAQPQPNAPNRAIQFSGVVVTEENGRMVPVPFANLYINERKTGTSTSFSGYFSIVAEMGEHVTFSAVGFRKAELKVPDTLRDDRYSMVQILSRDTILLAEAVIFPWPNRDYFKTEFLAMNVNNELERRAMDNLNSETLDKVRQATPLDGRETGSMYLRQQAKSYYYYGQAPPMNIFSPLAWSQFFSAWKNGDFKKKKKVGDDD